MIRIADHADYRLTFHPLRDRVSPTLVVTFGGQPADLEDRGFGTDFVASLGCDSVHVAQRHGTQYQGLSLDAFAAALSPISRDRADVVFYGSSLGGYAAIYYAGTVGARVITGAPVFPAWPPLGEGGYDDLTVTHIALADTPKTPHVPVVIFDPRLARDKFVVRKMLRPAYRPLHEIKVPYGYHTVLKTLARARPGLLRDLVGTFIRENRLIDFDPPGPGTAIFHAQRGSARIPGNLDGAKADLLRSLDLAVARDTYNELINCLIQRGELSEAQDWIDRGREGAHPKMTLFTPRAEAARAAGLEVGPLVE